MTFIAALCGGAADQGTFGSRGRKGITPMRVRIVAVPPGEAPEAIRRAWVGLVLPLAGGDDSESSKATGYGVLSRRPAWGILARLWHRLTGRPARSRQYIVPVDAAIAILDRTSPDAAKWWRDHTPYLFGVGDQFGFAAEMCEEVE